MLETHGHGHLRRNVYMYLLHGIKTTAELYQDSKNPPSVIVIEHDVHTF